MGPDADACGRSPSDLVMPLVLTEVLRWLPAFTAVAWLSLAALQVYRGRIHTRTETFFLLACLFAGGYAISDLLFFTATAEALAIVYVKLSLSSIVLAEMFYLLFAMTYVRRTTRVFWLFGGATAVVIALVWAGMVEYLDATGQLFVPVLRPDLFAMYLIYIVAVGVAGILSLYRIYRIVRQQSPSLAKRTAGLVVTFTLVLVVGLVTNGYLGMMKNTSIPPPFSSLLLPLALVTMYALYPGGRERISEAMRRFRAKRYVIQNAFLVFTDGTLVASAARGTDEIDRDLFSATLDVIQNFMRTSFPKMLMGKSLKTIDVEAGKIVIERGKYCYLAIVLSGEENDLLRRQLRDEIEEFEVRNSHVLAHWRGVQEDANGANAMLQRLLRPPELFPALAQ